MVRFNDLGEFSIDELHGLLELAGKLEREPEPRALQGKVLALLFLSPSLRTLTSFQAAMTRLGGSAFVVSPEIQKAIEAGLPHSKLRELAVSSGMVELAPAGIQQALQGRTTVEEVYYKLSG